MSTSLLYHGFGVRGYRYVRTQYVGGGVVFTIERKVGTCRCAACGSQNVWRQGGVVRRFRTVPIGNKRVELEGRMNQKQAQQDGRVAKCVCAAREVQLRPSTRQVKLVAGVSRTTGSTLK